MPTLRLLPTEGGGNGHGDEVLSCDFSPDSRFVVSGGWDGQLRIWDASSGAPVHNFQVSPKPVSACAVSPEGKHLLSGTLEGMLARWDAATFQQVSTFLAHTRPVSAITFGTDDRLLVTASWDRNIIVWKNDEEGRTLSGHGDIVAGCRVTPDGQHLLSWSHDCTVRLWDVVPRPRALATLKGHADRVLAGAISPDGHWGATGSRDHVLKLWELDSQREVATLALDSEVRCCFFLLDGLTLVTGEASGRLGLYSLPDLQEQGQYPTRLTIHCGALAPSGALIALGAGDGCIHLVEVEDFDSMPLMVSVTQSSRRTASPLQRLFGKSREIPTFLGTCPVCRAVFELPGGNPAVQAPCPGCKRQLRVCTVIAPSHDM